MKYEKLIRWLMLITALCILFSAMIFFAGFIPTVILNGIALAVAIVTWISIKLLCFFCRKPLF